MNRTRPRRSNRRGACALKLVVAGLVALVSVFTYCTTKSENKITDEVQHVGLTEEQEIALGLQASPQMTAQHGGLHPDRQLQERIDRIGGRLVERSEAGTSPYQFQFHVLRDERTVNAFALPGGQVFMTAGLAGRLETDDEIAAVLAHEVGHVVARHGAEHLAKQQLTQGLAGAAVIAAYDPNRPNVGRNAVIAMAIGQLVNLRYGREDELESDRLGIQFTGEAGYNPNAMVRVMEVLASAGGRSLPEFFSTHPNPANRIEKIKLEIRRQYPNGLPVKAEAEQSP